jgi:hypothetical protein
MHPDSTGACGEGGNPLPQISPQSSRGEEKALDDLSLDNAKDTSENVLLDYEYMALIWGIHPRRLKFCDEIVVTGLGPFFTAQAGTPSGRAEPVRRVAIPVHRPAVVVLVFVGSTGERARWITVSTRA